MKITKPLPREEYKKHLKDLNGGCAFCIMSPELTINEYSFWNWVFAAFPYRKYHTLLISKRHVVRFSELKKEELLELAEITEKLENHYRNNKIIGKGSLFGDQLFTCWRTRQNDKDKKSVSHLHLHFYPKFTNEEPINTDSWDIDIDKFKILK